MVAFSLLLVSALSDCTIPWRNEKWLDYGRCLAYNNVPKHQCTDYCIHKGQDPFTFQRNFDAEDACQAGCFNFRKRYFWRVVK